jgi:membrane protease YdiL (CAAX protease family)
LRTGNASGFQILFLSFAVLLLAVPLSSFISSQIGSTPAEAAAIGRGIPFVLGVLVLLGIPPLRRRTLAYLAVPIPRERRLEVALVGIGKVPLAFAYIGAVALWWWTTEGSASLAYHFESIVPQAQRAEALSIPGIFTFVVLGALLAPFVEEVLYRGLLFDAWAQRWGPFAATIFTSALFASYHPNVIAAFMSAVVLTCVVRRTGTLRASMAVHAFYNLMLWYPLAGQFGIPDASRALGDISTWGLNLACLLAAAIALPAYVLLAILRPYEPPAELP